jgi:hypothetical protein
VKKGDAEDSAIGTFSPSTVLFLHVSRVDVTDHHPDLGEALCHLSRVQFATGDRATALETLGRAVEAYKKV